MYGNMQKDHRSNFAPMPLDGFDALTSVTVVVMESGIGGSQNKICIDPSFFFFFYSSLKQLFIIQMEVN